METSKFRKSSGSVDGLPDKIEDVLDKENISIFNELLDGDEIPDELYEEIVRFAAKNDLPLVIPNYSIVHAELLCELLINRSRNSLLIFTGAIYHNFYNSLRIRNALKEAIDAGLEKIKICIDASAKKTTEEGGFISFCKEFNGRDIFNIFRLTQETEDKRHFYVSDNKRIRIEKPHDPILMEKGIVDITAKVNFNDPLTAKILVERFEELENADSEKII